MTQKGHHTWDLVINYHRCPNCGHIIESREDYHDVNKKRIKEVICEKCKQQFQVQKNRKSTFGPLIGNPQPPEFDWQ